MAKIAAALIVCLLISYTVAQQSPFGSPSNQQPSSSNVEGPQQPVSQHSGSSPQPASSGSEPQAVSTVAPIVTPGSNVTTPKVENGTHASKLTGKNGAASFAAVSSILLVVSAPLLL